MLVFANANVFLKECNTATLFALNIIYGAIMKYNTLLTRIKEVSKKVNKTV